MNQHYKIQLDSGYTLEFVSFDTYHEADNLVIDEFYEHYKSAFRDRPVESKEDLVGRLDRHATPHNHIAICRDGEDVIGGFILECYPCRYALLTFLFVLPSYEGKGIGTQLIISLKNYVDNILNESGQVVQKQVAVVLFEARVDAVFNGINYASISEFYYRQDVLECQLVNLYYVEPLSGDENYLLGVIPTISSGNIRETLTISSYFVFLEELYRSADPVNADGYLRRVKERVPKLMHEKLPIVEFPKLQCPILQITNASVALHIIQDQDKNIVVENNYYCKIFNSYEKDLFSQRYVEKPPYFSKYIDTKQVQIEFDDIVHFTSEGREETFIFVDHQGKLLTKNDRQKQANVFINHTYFPEGKKLIWTFVFYPVTHFNEFEIIQLEKYFTGNQESIITGDVDALNLSVRFRYKNRNFADFKSLASVMISDLEFEHNSQIEEGAKKRLGDVSLGSILAGAVQVDTSGIKFSRTPTKRVQLAGRSNFSADAGGADLQWRDIYQYYNSDESSRKNEDGVDSLEAIYLESNSLEYALNSFCGIALGIFDFQRMSFEEVGDTLVPLASTDLYFLILNKSSITCFCHDNKLYSNSIKYGIGINPYVMIPNTVLAYNSFWTEYGERHLKAERQTEIAETGWSVNQIRSLFKKKKETRSLYLTQISNDLSVALHAEVLNVFQYDTEISVYNAGMEKRGIREKRRELERRKSGYDEELRGMDAKRSNAFGMLSIILSVISLTQIYQFVQEICKRIVASTDPSIHLENVAENDPRVYGWALGISFIFMLIFVVLIYRFYMASENSHMRRATG